MRRIAAHLVVLALLGIPAAAAAEGKEVRVIATVLSYVKITSLVNPPALDVSADDVARGYVDVDGGSSLGVVTNSNGGYLVTATGAAGMIARVQMRIDNVGGGERVHVPSGPFVNTLIRVAYRLYLEPGVAAGRHPWPIALGLSRA